MTGSKEDAFLGARATLRPAHAVAALLQLADSRYVMQLRDAKPNIFYPDHWGFFGGARVAACAVCHRFHYIHLV